MKKLFLLCAMALSMTAYAETITLNLATATDVNGDGLEYDATGVMDSTYSEDYTVSPFIYTNDFDLMFSHLPSGNSWSGTSWEGFTLSKKNTNTGDQFECAAKGGLTGEGTPFVVGYYSSYFASTTTEYPSSSIIVFDGDHYPQEVYICQSARTLQSMKEGDAYARPFTDQDTLALLITGINNLYEELTDTTITYYLAVDGKFNEAWTKVDLSAIGACMGLSFRMTTTDIGQWGANTPFYFALDGLTISTDEPTGVQNAVVAPKATKRIVNGQLLIERDGKTYNAVGQTITK